MTVPFPFVVNGQTLVGRVRTRSVPTIRIQEFVMIDGLTNTRALRDGLDNTRLRTGTFRR